MADTERERIMRGEPAAALTELMARTYATDWGSADDRQRIWWRLRSLDVREAIGAAGYAVVPRGWHAIYAENCSPRGAAKRGP